ncbi:nuclear transport factor 2 family protein [Streptomyces sp. NPDC059373]
MPDHTQPQSPEAVVRRYLRVLEPRRITDLLELVAEDVLAHGAGQNVTGRHHRL